MSRIFRKLTLHFYCNGLEHCNRNNLLTLSFYVRILSRMMDWKTWQEIVSVLAERHGRATWGVLAVWLAQRARLELPGLEPPEVTFVSDALRLRWATYGDRWFEVVFPPEGDVLWYFRAGNVTAAGTLENGFVLGPQALARLGQIVGITHGT